MIPANLPSITFYRVQPGDTLFIISRKYGVSIQSIVIANNLADPNRLDVGKLLIIPRIPIPGTSLPPTTTPPVKVYIYEIKPGDNLDSIADRYNTSV